MSGSDSKRKRKEQRTEGLDKWQVKEQEALEKKKKVKRRVWIAVPIVAVFLVFIILMNTSLPYTKLTAVQVGKATFSAADFNYYYQTVYGNFMNTYNEAMDQLLDTNKSLKDQMFDEKQTWADYFTSLALATIKETTALCEAAAEAGFTLSQEEQDEIDEQIEAMAMYYAYYGFKNVDQYFAYMYGRGMDKETFRRNVEMVVLSEAYGRYVKENAEFSDAEVLAEYQENQGDYDKVVYRYYYFGSGTNVNTEEEEREAAMAETKAEAEAFADYATTEAKFQKKALEYMEADESKTEEDIAPYRYSSGTLRRYTVSSLSSNYSDWLTDSSRAYGDVAVLEGTNGYGVLFYVGADDGHYDTRSFRQILVKVGKDGADDAPGTAHDKAWEKAEGYVQEWEDKGATEDAFAELAGTYSADTDTYKDGGLMENVYLGQMATEVEEWVYDEGRKNGDVEIVEAEDGLHILFYLDEGEPYWSLAALNKLQSDYYETWREELNEGYTAETKLGMKFTTK